MSFGLMDLLDSIGQNRALSALAFGLTSFGKPGVKQNMPFKTPPDYDMMPGSLAGPSQTCRV